MFSSKSEQEKYRMGVEKLTKSEVWIYCEGKTNALFYQNFPEISKIPFQNGGSCSDIILKVSRDSFKYGIIDNDYRVEVNYDRIYPIDFYSIENIFLEYWPFLSSFKEIIKEKEEDIGLNSLIYHNIESNITYDLSRKPIKFDISLSRKENSADFKYLMKSINDIEHIYKYKRLKKVILEYFKFLKIKHGCSKDTMINHSNLYDYIPNGELCNIFKTEVYRKLENELISKKL